MSYSTVDKETNVQDFKWIQLVDSNEAQVKLKFCHGLQSFQITMHTCYEDPTKYPQQSGSDMIIVALKLNIWLANEGADRSSKHSVEAVRGKRRTDCPDGLAAESPGA